jgi:hypothetical protein
MKKVTYLLLAISIISCSKSNKKEYLELEKLNWLIGNWHNQLDGGDLTENWTKLNDSTFTSRTLFIIGKDTIHDESIVLTQKGNHLLYIPTVKGQNNDKPVEFKFNSETDKENEFIFENPAHDYPKKIVYKKINDTSLVASIYGKQDGKDVNENYPMTKK